MLLWPGVILLLAALASLAAARFLTGPVWVDALLAALFFASLAAGVGIGGAARRLSPARWKIWAALLLGGGATVGRFALLQQLTAVPEPVPRIEIPKLLLAVGTVGWAALALLWGVAAVAQTLGGTSARPGRSAWGGGLLAGLAVALALYSLAPLSYLLGLGVNHWTVLGLFVLALVAHGVGLLHARLWRHRRTSK